MPCMLNVIQVSDSGKHLPGWKALRIRSQKSHYGRFQWVTPKSVFLPVETVLTKVTTDFLVAESNEFLSVL